MPIKDAIPEQLFWNILFCSSCSNLFPYADKSFVNSQMVMSTASEIAVCTKLQLPGPLFQASDFRMQAKIGKEQAEIKDSCAPFRKYCVLTTFAL